MPETHTPLSVQGCLDTKDVKQLTRHLRSGTVGPTALYYAGVTAPIVSAAMALVANRAFTIAGMSNYWQVLLSAIVAAMAGIVWYVIFMRWSYRHRHGRAQETLADTEVCLIDGWLVIKRGKVETKVQWSGIEAVVAGRGAMIITFEGADALIIPDRWFENRPDAKAEFLQRLNKAASA